MVFIPHLSDRFTARVVEPAEGDLTNNDALSSGSYREGTMATSMELQTAPKDMNGIARKVLIVEDTMELAEVIAATLEHINIVPVHESHVDRALERYYTERPDLILLDIGLPDKTGWKLLDAIKERDETDMPVVIVITAHDDPANRLMGKLQDVHSYLIKPFTPDEVEQVVRAALRNRTRVIGVPGDMENAPLPDFIRELIDEDKSDIRSSKESPGEGHSPIR